MLMHWTSRIPRSLQSMSVTQQLLVFLSITSWCSIRVTTGLQCFECLSLECESQVICESIKIWMNKTLAPKRQYIEFNPNTNCPDSSIPLNSTEWTSLSAECPKSDSVCLEAPIEAETDFDGLKDNLQLENHTKIKSSGILRGCANRRFVQQPDAATIEVKVDTVNDTLPTAKEAVLSQKLNAEDKYVIQFIHSHHIFIDQGTQDSFKCYEDNCNHSKRPKKSSAENSKQVGKFGLLIPLVGVIVFQL